MKIKGLDSREITSLSKSKNVMNMACNFHYCRKKPCAPHKTDLHTTWIIERLDKKLTDVIAYNTVEKCDVTSSRAIQPLTSDVLRLLFFLTCFTISVFD